LAKQYQKQQHNRAQSAPPSPHAPTSPNYSAYVNYYAQRAQICRTIGIKMLIKKQLSNFMEQYKQKAGHLSCSDI
jgi:hypothetical protein